jgi:hypothetical protein
MKFELEQNDAAALINVLGQLPTNSGVFPILVNLVEQYKAQQEVPKEADHE